MHGDVVGRGACGDVFFMRFRPCRALRSMLSGKLPLYPEGLYPWLWVPKPWNVVLDKCIRGPKPRVTNINGTNLTSSLLILGTYMMAQLNSPPAQNNPGQFKATSPDRTKMWF